MMQLDAIPAIDHHAHNLLRPDTAQRFPLAAAFTEAYDPDFVAHHARTTLCYRRSLREIATLLDCPPDEEAVLARRTALGFDELVKRSFAAANLEAVFLDDGFLPDLILPLADHSRYVPVSRLLRLESVAQELLPHSRTFDDFIEHFRAALDPPHAPIVGFKTILAYRSGLAVQPSSGTEAEAGFDMERVRSTDRPVRLTDKHLLDHLLLHALDIAARQELPLQIHTGFGDPDLDLRLSNPLHLRPIFEDRHYRKAPIVLLHAGYPFVRETAYLAAVYPHVYVDYGLTVPMLSVAGMRAVVRMLLEQVPTSKLLFSTDAHYFPELYALGAKWGRNALAHALDLAVTDGDLSSTEADAAAHAVLRDNAHKLYTRR